MPWTYDPTKFNDPAVSTDYPPATLGQLMQVRFLVQDTKTTSQIFQDDEIYWLLTKEANVFMAAAAACDSLIGAARGVRSKRISEFSINYDLRFYTVLSTQLRARGAFHQNPYVGGISISDKEAQQANTDWVAPAFPRGLGNNPAAPQPETPSANPLTSV